MQAFTTTLRRQAERRVERPAPVLLSDRLDAWARSLPPGRLARGLVLAEIAHAMRVGQTTIRAVLLDAGWRYRYPEGDERPRVWSPPWLEADAA